MKTKTTVLIPSIAALLALVPLSQAADAPSPTTVAMAKVNAEIFEKTSPRAQPFSRVAPIPRERLEFEPQLVTDGETRLPFAIKSNRTVKGEPAVVLAGYVRLSDQAIFLLVPETKAYVPAAQHPRFAPKPAAQPEPVRPT